MDDRELSFKAQEIALALNVPVGQSLVPLKNAILSIREAGYVAGMEMERRLMRLRLGLAVKGDSDG